jgi:carboxylesterase
VNTQTIPTTEPFFLPGGRTGVLLIHGFTGAPKEMRWMGDYLNEQGYTCLGIRLAGHATDPEDMIRSRWTDWTASVEDGYNLLRDSTDRIFLAGLSMGGVLSLLMSARLAMCGWRGGDVHAVFPARGLFARVILCGSSSHLCVRQICPKIQRRTRRNWFDKEAFKSHVSYPANPVRSIAELKLLTLEMQKALPDVRTPVLLIHSKNDKYVPPESLERIYAALVNASDKTKAYVTESGHVVTRDAARHQVFELARDFINNVIAKSE